MLCPDSSRPPRSRDSRGARKTLMAFAVRELPSDGVLAAAAANYKNFHVSRIPKLMTYNASLGQRLNSGISSCSFATMT